MAKKQKIERAALVACAKDMNDVLGLNPKIATKVKGEPVGDDVLAKSIIKYARGWDDEKNKPDPSQAVNRESDDLKKSTWETLEQLGAVVATATAPLPEKVKEPKAKEEKLLKNGATGELKKPQLKKPPLNRIAGKFPKEWKELKAHLENLGNATSLARRYDQQLLKKQTLGEHLKDSLLIQKEIGVVRGIIPHIKWRYEESGWDFKDTRKHEHDENGMVYLTGVSGSGEKRKLGIPKSPPKLEKPAKKGKPSEKPVAEKPVAEKPAAEKPAAKKEKSSKKEQ